MTSIEYVTNGQLADTSIVVIAGIDIGPDIINRVLAQCAAAGTEPVIVIIDDHRNLRFITNTDIANTAVLLLARNQWQPHPEHVTALGDAILARCQAAGIKAPVMVTSDSPHDDIRLAVSTADDARELVDYLTERFEL